MAVSRSFAYPTASERYLYGLGKKRESTINDVINIIFLCEVLDNFRIQFVLGYRILDEVSSGSRAFFYFPVLYLLCPFNNLVKVDLLDGKIEGILLVGCFHLYACMCFSHWVLQR